MGDILLENKLYFEDYFDNANLTIWKETLGAGKNSPLSSSFSSSFYFPFLLEFNKIDPNVTNPLPNLFGSLLGL